MAGAFAASRLFSHVGERFQIWLHPFSGSNPFGNAYQLVQGLYGMASGGILLMRLSATARRPAPQPIQDEGMTQVVNLS